MVMWRFRRKQCETGKRDEVEWILEIKSCSPLLSLFFQSVYQAVEVKVKIIHSSILKSVQIQYHSNVNMSIVHTVFSYLTLLRFLSVPASYPSQ